MTPEEIPQALVDILDRRAGKTHSRTGPVLAALAEILTHHEGQTMTTTFKIDITQTSSGTPANGPRAVLAQLDTHDPAVAAATLRAVADQLDPPRPPRPTYRNPPTRTGAVLPVDVPAGRITPDGCGPEHTYKGSCVYASVPRSV